MTTTASCPTTLLLIEDADAAAAHFDAVLREAAPADFEVERATSLAEAMSYLETRTADCAIVDVDIANVGGLALVEQFAARSPGVPLVAITSRTDDEIGLATFHAGVIDVLSTRALDANMLISSIRHAILLKRSELSLDEVQSIARIGSWAVELASGEVSWSHELYRLLGFGEDQTPGYQEILDRIHPDDRESTIAAVTATVASTNPFTIEHRVLLPDGSECWMRFRGRVELDGDGAPARLLGTAQDISEERAAAAALLHQELHDPLTGLPNRRLLVDRIEQALARLARMPLLVGVIHFDVDRFKVINDNLGYAAGDQLLLATATRLTDLIRPEDTLARIEGDEFVVLCEGLTDQAEATSIADRICAAMSEPLDWAGGELVISVSAGIALASSSSVEAGALLGDADAAMYRAKAAGVPDRRCSPRACARPASAGSTPKPRCANRS